MGDIADSRRSVIELLMTLSDAIAAVEEIRRSVHEDESALERIGEGIAGARQASPDPQRLAGEIPAEARERLAPVLKVLTDHPEHLDEEGRELVAARGGTTGAQMLRTLEISHDVYTRLIRDRATKHLELEERLRSILQLIASARDEGA
jgi:hypothetical protein